MNKFQEYIYKLQMQTIQKLSETHEQSQFQAGVPSTILSMISNIQKSFVQINQDEIINSIIPKLMSPRLSSSFSVVGTCNVHCHKCGLVPLQHAEFNCGHVYCSPCLLMNAQFNSNSIACPGCYKQSDMIRWHSSTHKQVLTVTDIICPHCELSFNSLSEFIIHEQENGDYFKPISLVQMNEKMSMLSVQESPAVLKQGSGSKSNKQKDIIGQERGRSCCAFYCKLVVLIVVLSIGVTFGLCKLIETNDAMWVQYAKLEKKILK
ncbi:RING-type [Hexamita inflata]|uniref:RING-type n=1 Tax=Hexamita inflata TaxID=28002 RepID=A0AA86PU73_9EUKA|nr:RING-type [Hexamita inflata]